MKDFFFWLTEFLMSSFSYLFSWGILATILVMVLNLIKDFPSWVNILEALTAYGLFLVFVAIAKQQLKDYRRIEKWKEDSRKLDI